MLRKTVLVGMASLVFATPSFSGFYVGAAVGPEAANFKKRAHVFANSGTFNAIDTNHFAALGVFGSLFAGYQWIRNYFYLAAEVNANMSSLEYKLTNDEYTHFTFSKTTFTIKRSFGISILPGYLITPSTVLYGRLGYANGRVDIAESDPTTQSMSGNRGGIRYGLGIRHVLTPRLTMMMDYSQINYKSFNSEVFEPFGGVTKETKITPYSAQVAFGLIYNFDTPLIVTK